MILEDLERLSDSIIDFTKAGDWDWSITHLSLLIQRYLLFSLLKSFILDKLGRKKDAKIDYIKAIDIKPEYAITVYHF